MGADYTDRAVRPEGAKGGKVFHILQLNSRKTKNVDMHILVISSLTDSQLSCSHLTVILPLDILQNLVL